MNGPETVVDQQWVFRPLDDRPGDVQALAGQPVHAAGVRDADGLRPIVLSDGTRLRARPGEVAVQ